MTDKEIDQHMKPHGEEGIEVINEMNEEHVNIFEFASECVNVNDNDKILDLGCGGGINIEKFLKMTNNNVDGLDYSEVSVAESIKRNQDAIDAKRCKIIQSDVSKIPIADESYDLVTAFSTIFFWPNLEETLKEVLRIIKANGQFMIGNGTDGTNPNDEEWQEIEGMTLYTPQQLEKYLLDAGFSSAKVFIKENEHIAVIIGQK